MLARLDEFAEAENDEERHSRPEYPANCRANGVVNGWVILFSSHTHSIPNCVSVVKDSRG